MTGPRARTVKQMWRGNFAAIMRGNLANSILSLAAGLTLAKVLAPDGRGILAIALAWPGIALVVFGLGLRNAAAFFAARYPERHPEVLRVCLQLAALSTVTILVVGFGGSWLLVRDQETLLVALLIAFSATPFAMLTAIGRGMLNAINLKRWSRVRLIQPAVYAGAVLLFAAAGHLTVAAGAIAYFLSLAVSAVSVWRLVPPRSVAADHQSFMRLRKEVLRYGLKSTLALSAQVTNVRLDVALLGVFVSATDVGLYAVASSLTQYIVPLSTAAAPWVFPRIARGRPSAESWIEGQRAVRITVVMAVAMALAMAVLAPLVLTRLIGREWDGVLVPLWILLVGAVMQSVRFTQVSIAGAMNRPELSAHSEAVAAVATVVLLWPMVHLFGVAGAAMVSVIAYTIGALLLRGGIVRAVRRSTSVV